VAVLEIEKTLRVSLVIYAVLAEDESWSRGHCGVIASWRTVATHPTGVPGTCVTIVFVKTTYSRNLLVVVRRPLLVALSAELHWANNIVLSASSSSGAVPQLIFQESRFLRFGTKSLINESRKRRRKFASGGYTVDGGERVYVRRSYSMYSMGYPIYGSLD
jgi:hypothetical protein